MERLAPPDETLFLIGRLDVATSYKEPSALSKAQTELCGPSVHPQDPNAYRKVVPLPPLVLGAMNMRSVCDLCGGLPNTTYLPVHAPMVLEDCFGADDSEPIQEYNSGVIFE